MLKIDKCENDSMAQWLNAFSVKLSGFALGHSLRLSFLCAIA